MPTHTCLSSEFFYQAIAGEFEVKESGIQILAPQSVTTCVVLKLALSSVSLYSKL